MNNYSIFNVARKMLGNANHSCSGQDLNSVGCYVWKLFVFILGWLNYNIIWFNLALNEYIISLAVLEIRIRNWLAIGQKMAAI